MGLLDRLRALLRRPPRDVPVGRHSRVLPGPSVPGAAAALVATTGTAGVLRSDAAQAEPVPADPAEPIKADAAQPEPVPADPAGPIPADAAQPEPDPAEPVTAGPVPAEPVPAEPDPAEPDPAEPDPAEPGPAEPGPVPAEPAAPPGAVTLGFADGGTLALDPDDPRVRTFKAAAEALLEEPRP
jgi:hypothetical protein